MRHYSVHRIEVEGLSSLSQTPFSFLRIIPRTRLCRQLQGFRRIILRHEQLDKMQLLRLCEVLIIEQVLRFLLVLDLIRLRIFGRTAKGGDEVGVFPLGDVIVSGVHAVDVAFDCVALVVDEEARKTFRLAQKMLLRAKFRELVDRMKAYMIGLRFCRIMVLTSCAVNSNEPSPTKRTVRRFPVSFAAKAAP